MSNTEALRAACTAMLAALDGMADRDNAGGLMPWVGYFGPYDGTDYGAALDAAMADARAELAQPAASGEPVAPKCPTPKGCEHNGLCRGRCTEPQPAPARMIACVCGEPGDPGIIHRSDGPCYVREPAPARVPLTLPQLRRLWDNSPERHADCTSRAAFIRVATLVLAATGTPAQGEPK